MAILQVKGMDERLYRALCARASREHRSVSQEVVKIVQEHLSRPCGSGMATGEELLSLAGSWKDDRSEKEIARDIRKSRCNRRRDRDGQRVRG
jgi:plasmid stability protein